MQLIDKPLSRSQLQLMADTSFGNLVKAVVDIKKRQMVVDVSLHADAEAFLISNGSAQSDVWGINLYPALTEDDFIEFDSMINIRPGQSNTSRGVDDPNIRSRIIKLVSALIT